MNATALQKLPRSFYDRDTVTVARELLGKWMVRRIDGEERIGRIVEVEAYLGPLDLAAHSSKGRTARTEVMFGPPGRAYVYRSYGIHWCVNFVCEAEGSASAVLIRALEPTHGVDAMRARRGLEDVRTLCSGPGKLTQALGISIAANALPLDAAPFAIHRRLAEPDIVTGPRIGIPKAADYPGRFGLRGSRFLSKPFPH